MNLYLFKRIYSIIPKTFKKEWGKKRWIGIVLLFVLTCCSQNFKKVSQNRGMEPMPEDISLKEGYRPDLWVLAVGVSKYAKESMRLKYAAVDAQEVARKLKEQEKKLFRKVHIKMLLNEEATRNNIIDSFDFLNKAGPEDVAFIFVAGHGIKRRATGSYYFLPYNANWENLAREGLMGVNFRENIAELSDNTNKVILVLDTCHAGGIEEGRGDVVDLATLFRGMEGLYTLAASKSGEVSYEDDECKHGMFTCSLLNAFVDGDNDKDGILMFSELVQYVSNMVPKKSNGHQHPYQITKGTDLPIASMVRGFITVNSIPWGYITIDGESKGKLPIVNYALLPGEHRLEITRQGYVTYREIIQVKEWASIRRSVSLKTVE